jgi:hypothetical protein
VIGRFAESSGDKLTSSFTQPLLDCFVYHGYGDLVAFATCKSPMEMLNPNGEPGKLLVRSAKSWPALPGGCADWWKEHLANRIDGVVL